jgi:hypothetical protein
MRGRVVVGFSEIAPARQNLPVAHDHGAECIIALARFIDGHAHELSIVRRATGVGKYRLGRQYGGGCQRNNDASAAMQVHRGIATAMIVQVVHMGLLNAVQVSLNKFVF